ncbi:avidin-like isoform X2 [Sphaerodactylus townsendi]|uniref:avidin-like isoform X2 n=1 Tax=Sphaerodactylus townsendi TaxID=933632 RepID=UPI002025F6DD|nr:avidin-like isoform X2 [Sphaerodactylus townsendi]
MERLPLQPAWALLAAFLLASSATGADEAPSKNKQPAPPCTLSGTWVNDLGSRMVISAANAAGVFSGSYLTAVSSANQAIAESALQGAQHDPAQDAQPTFAFTVRWAFSDSATAFVGQCFVDQHGEETLETLWLLRQNVPSRSEDWKATRVGKNVFTRVK